MSSFHSKISSPFEDALYCCWVIRIELLQSKFVLKKELCTSEITLKVAMRLLNLSNLDVKTGVTQLSMVFAANLKNSNFRYLLVKWRMSLQNEILRGMAGDIC